MSDLFEKLTAPIAGGSPFGEDARYDLDFDRLKNEMEKLGGIDIDTVESLSVKILTEKSKDIRALAWLAYVMMRKNDVERLAGVFGALAHYCQDHLDRIFPVRENAKIAALRWFSESRFSGQCEKITVTADDVPHLTKLVEALARLRTALDKQFSDGAPPMSSLYKYANDWKKAAELAAKAPEPKVEAPEGAGSAGNAAPPSSSGSPATVIGAGEGVTIELTREQYRELSECIQKIKTLLTIQ